MIYTFWSLDVQICQLNGSSLVYVMIIACLMPRCYLNHFTDIVWETFQWKVSLSQNEDI